MDGSQSNRAKALTLKQRIREMKSVQYYLNRIGKAWAHQCIMRAPVGEYWQPQGASSDRIGGTLRNSIRWVQDSNNLGHLELVYYARYVTSGTGAYQIGPRKQKYLIFPWQQSPSGWYMGKGPVNHPAIQANPFIAEAWASSEVQGIIREMRQGLSVRRL